MQNHYPTVKFEGQHHGGPTFAHHPGYFTLMEDEAVASHYATATTLYATVLHRRPAQQTVRLAVDTNTAVQPALRKSFGSTMAKLTNEGTKPSSTPPWGRSNCHQQVRRNTRLIRPAMVPAASRRQVGQQQQSLRPLEARLQEIPSPVLPPSIPQLTPPPFIPPSTSCPPVPPPLPAASSPGSQPPIREMYHKTRRGWGSQAPPQRSASVSPDHSSYMRSWQRSVGSRQPGPHHASKLHCKETSEPINRMQLHVGPTCMPQNDLGQDDFRLESWRGQSDDDELGPSMPPVERRIIRIPLY